MNHSEYFHMHLLLYNFWDIYLALELLSYRLLSIISLSRHCLTAFQNVLKITRHLKSHTFLSLSFNCKLSPFRRIWDTWKQVESTLGKGSQSFWTHNLRPSQTPSFPWKTITYSSGSLEAYFENRRVSLPCNCTPIPIYQQVSPIQVLLNTVWTLINTSNSQIKILYVSEHKLSCLS